MAEHPMGNGGGLVRALRAAKCSAQGLQAAWDHETAFRQELTLCLVFVPLAVWIADSLTKLLVLLGSLCMVLIAELLNSAIEAVVDRVGIDYHELAGRAKDMGSAAVFVSMSFTVLAYSLIAVDRYIVAIQF